MGYYSSLMSRKFSDLVGSQYEQIRSDYCDFLLTEEELALSPIKNIIMPLDYTHEGLPQHLLTTLHLFTGATIHLTYIIDTQIITRIERILGSESADEYTRLKKEKAGEFLKIGTELLYDAGFSVQSSIVTGSKLDDCIRLASDQDLVVLSKRYGTDTSVSKTLSPIALRINREIGISILFY